MSASTHSESSNSDGAGSPVGPVLVGRVIVVSGAGGGIGTAAVDAITTAGGSVVALDLGGAGLEALRGRDGVLVVEGDVTVAASWVEARKSGLDTFGAIHGLVNNAGVEGAIAPILEYPDAMFDLVLAVNVKGVFTGMQTMAPS